MGAKKLTVRLGLAAAALTLCAHAGAQLLPPLPDVGDVLGSVDRLATDTLEGVGRSARDLAGDRLRRLRGLVRENRDVLEMTDLGPAVRGEVVAIDPDAATLAVLERAGFVRQSDETIDSLGIRMVTFRVPPAWSVDRALNRLRRLAPEAEFAANHLHVPSGTAAASAAMMAPLAQGGAPAPAAVGLIDGGVAAHPALRGSVQQQRGFVRGAPRPSAHGTAVASLIAGRGTVRGAAPEAPLMVADIYGGDPAGGNAVALARALGWLVQSRVPVVAVSLVGPANPLVARAVAQARARGTFIVASVGNDGPAAPPAYPASYPGVIAVTGVDGRGRVLVEAGRALDLDYAAPGADMAAAGANGGLVPVRGTSYAVPFVAGRLAHHVRGGRPIAALDAEAEGGGRRGVGRGVICGDCRTPYRRN